MIEREERDGIVTVRLAHGKASALDLELARALETEFRRIADSDARAVVLTGTGTIFSAGVDLFRVVDGGAEYVRNFFPGLVGAFHALFTIPIPVVAAVNGHAIAGGCILTEACDYRIMARGAGRIGVPELLVGVPFPPYVLEILRCTLPPQRLQSIVYTGRTFDAEEALEWGLVDEVANAESLAERADAMARQFAEIPRESFRLTKLNLRRPVLRLAGEDERSAEARAVWESPEIHERIRAYLERTIGKSGKRE